MNGSTVKAVRLSLGLTQTEFSKRIGYSRQSVYFIENNIRIASSRFISAIKKEFDITEQTIQAVAVSIASVKIGGVRYE